MSAARFVALLAVVPLAAAFAAPASAAGDSTPGVTVTASNPAGSKAGGPTLSLTAHTEASAFSDPSCRPEDLTLECWGSLVLRLPAYGDLAVGSFEVHRVAVGDISCGARAARTTAAATTAWSSHRHRPGRSRRR
ncbi:MAG: hypothetical protein ACTHKG_15145 [Nocardioides sp.]